MIRNRLFATLTASLSLAAPASAEVAYDSLTGASATSQGSLAINDGQFLRQAFTPTTSGYMRSVTVPDFNRNVNGARHVARLFSGDSLIGVCQVTYGQAPKFLDPVTPFSFTFEDQCIEIIAGSEYVVEFSLEQQGVAGAYTHYIYALNGFPALEVSTDGGQSYISYSNHIPMLVEIEDEPTASIAHPRPTNAALTTMPIVGSNTAFVIAQRQGFRAQGSGIVDSVSFNIRDIFDTPVGPMRVSIVTDTGIELSSTLIGETQLAEFLRTESSGELRTVELCGARLINNLVYYVQLELPLADTSIIGSWGLHAVEHGVAPEFPLERRGVAGPDTWDVFNPLAVLDMQVDYQPIACTADVQTTNTNPGDAGYGSPDGMVDGADLSYYVEQWLAGCP